MSQFRKNAVLQTTSAIATAAIFCLALPSVAHAKKPKSPIHFFFVKKTGEVDEETGKDIFLLQRRVEIQGISYDKKGEGKILLLTPEKGGPVPEKSEIRNVDSIGLGFSTREVAHEKKELFEQAPAELVLFAEKEEGKADLSYIRILPATQALLKTAEGGRVLTDDVNRSHNLGNTAEEMKLRKELTQIEERVRRLHEKKVDYYRRSNRVLKPLLLRKKLEEVEKKIGKLREGDTQGAEALELKKEALESLIYEGPQGALGTNPNTSGPSGHGNPATQADGLPSYGQVSADPMNMDCHEGHSGSGGHFFCDLSTVRATQPLAKPNSTHGNATLEELGIHLVALPGGTFQMGSPSSEANRNSSEKQHSVTLSPFELMDAAVTQKTYALIMGHNPSRFQKPEDCKGADGQTDFEEIHVDGKTVKVCAEHPVEKVSWNKSQTFISKLNEKVKSIGYQFKLPTEAQYEFAFRGGTTTAYVSGETDSGLGDFVWYSTTSGGRTHSVRSKKANDYAVYRSSVWEWSQDWYGGYPDKGVIEPTGPSSGSNRVIRGCSWYSSARGCRSAQRGNYSPDDAFDNLGFRLLRTH